MTLGDSGAAGLRFVRIARRQDVPRGLTRRFSVGGEEVLLCDVDGELFAVRDECTHESFPLSEGTLTGGTLICRLHGARFDVRTGEVLAPPAYERLRTYPVKMEGDDVWVAIPAAKAPE